MHLFFFFFSRRYVDKLSKTAYFLLKYQTSDKYGVQGKNCDRNVLKLFKKFQYDDTHNTYTIEACIGKTRLSHGIVCQKAYNSINIYQKILFFILYTLMLM